MDIKKIILLVILVTSSIVADEGKELFDKHCSKCHATVLGMVNDGGYENSYLTSAPYVVDLVAKLKEETGSEEKFAVFIKEYIQNPDKRKSLATLTTYLYRYNDKKNTQKKEAVNIPKEITKEEKLFDKYCSKCHATVLGMVNDGGYENTYMTPAPYVVDLVAKLKEETGSEEKFAVFIKEYIQNPDKRKSLME